MDLTAHEAVLTLVAHDADVALFAQEAVPNKFEEVNAYEALKTYEAEVAF